MRCYKTGGISSNPSFVRNLRSGLAADGGMMLSVVHIPQFVTIIDDAMLKDYGNIFMSDFRLFNRLWSRLQQELIASELSDDAVVHMCVTKADEKEALGFLRKFDQQKPSDLRLYFWACGDLNWDGFDKITFVKYDATDCDYRESFLVVESGSICRALIMTPRVLLKKDHANSRYMGVNVTSRSAVHSLITRLNTIISVYS